MIRVSGSSFDGGGVYDGGNTLAEARKEAEHFVAHSLRAQKAVDIAIVKSAPYHKTKNPYGERLLIVESVQSPPIGGYRDPSRKQSSKAKALNTFERAMIQHHRGGSLRARHMSSAVHDTMEAAMRAGATTAEINRVMDNAAKATEKKRELQYRKTLSKRDPKRPGFYVQAPLSSYDQDNITAQARWALGLGRLTRYPNNPETLHATLPSGMKVRLLPKPAKSPRGAHRTTDRLQAYCEYCGKWFGTGNITQHQIVHGVGSPRELQRYEQLKAKGFPASLKRHREFVQKRSGGSGRDADRVDYVLVYGGKGTRGFSVSQPYALKKMAIEEAKALSRPNAYGDEVRVGMRKDGRVFPVGSAKNGVFHEAEK